MDVLGMELVRDLVHLRLQGIDPLVVRIVEVREDGLLLTAPYEAHRQFVPVAGTPLKLGFLTEEGTTWLTAVAVGPELGDRPAFGVRFLDQGVRRERRRQPRAKVSFPVEVAGLAAAAPVPGTAMDVSDGGLRAHVPMELSVGDAVQMTIIVPEGSPVRLTASVSRADPDHVYVFAYGLFAAGSRDRLVELSFRASALAPA
jgi:PilZ domain-containing protein